MPREDKPQQTVLIVEDFEDTRQMLARELRRAGYRVIEASDGREALEVVAHDPPDLVVMDLSLPKLDGLSAVYRMRELEAMRQVPVIACSAHSADTHSKAARAVGCDEYITKPIDLAHLSEEVNRLLAENVGRRRVDVGRGESDARLRSDDELIDYIDGLLGTKA